LVRKTDLCLLQKYKKLRIYTRINHSIISVADKQTNDTKMKDKKSLGELQKSTKCIIKPSDHLTKLECKDWPLLFKVGDLIHYKYFLYVIAICNNTNAI